MSIKILLATAFAAISPPPSMRIHYKLEAGEAGWVLRQDRVVEY